MLSPFFADVSLPATVREVGVVRTVDCGSRFGFVQAVAQVEESNQHLPNKHNSSHGSGYSEYCKTLNVSVPFSRATQNHEIKGHEYQLQAKIGLNYYSISNCMVLIRQNKGAKIILHAKSSTFRAAKLKGFTVCSIETGLAPSVTL